MDIEPYKSLRSTIFEVQAPTAKTSKKPSSVNTPWQTASGNWGAKNKDGVVDYFDSEENAKAWLSGTHKPAGRVDPPGDISTKVDLDDEGYEKKEPKKDGRKPSGSNGTNGQPQTQQTQANKTQYQAQQKSVRPGEPQATNQVKPVAQPSDAGDHSDVAAKKPKTELSKSIKKDPQATEKAKERPDIRKANVLAQAIKNKELAGPSDDSESVFGNAKAERSFVDEMNHAALSAMRGQTAYDFELCSQVFGHIGFCFEPPEGKKKVTKDIPRKSMPQFSSQVDPKNTESEAFKALMASKNYTSPEQVTPEDLKAEINMEKQFRGSLEEAGYEIIEEEIPVTSLKPIQGELKGEKVVSMYGTLAAAQVDPANYEKQAARLLEPIYVTDGYVIDGHHRWAAQCVYDIANGKGADATMKTRTITKKGKPVPVDEIIEFSNKFQKDIGLLSQTRGGETVKKTQTQKESVWGNRRMSPIVQSIHESIMRKMQG